MATIQDYIKRYEAELAASGEGPALANMYAPAPTATRTPKPVAGGMIASAKQAVGSAIKGAGQFGTDILGADVDNAVKRYGQSVIDANPTAIKSLGDIAESPVLATREAVGNAAGYGGLMAGTRALGMGISALPIPGALPVGQAIAWGGPALAAALPSFGGIRERQIQKDPTSVTSGTDKVAALVGSAAVGAIERFGPEGLILSSFNRTSRENMAKQFVGKTLAGSIGKTAVKTASQEALEEIAQNPIEQLAAYDNPLDAENVRDTLFAGAMGALGGGAIGSVYGAVRHTAPSQVTPDDLKGAIDEQLAPPVETPSDPTMQAEGRDTLDLTGDPTMQAEGRDTLDLTGDPVQADPLAGVTTPELTRMLGLVEQSIVSGQPMPGAENTMQRIRDVLATREETPTPDTRTLPMFDDDGRLSPEAMIAERTPVASVTPDMSADEVAARLQAAQQPGPQGQAALMANQLPTPSPIEIITGGTPVRIPETTLKGLPAAAKTELSKHLGDPQTMAAAVADMFYTKAGAGSSAAYVFDKLPALYQQLTGQPLPETPAPTQEIRPTAIGAQGAEFLQGETPEQAAANYARAQEIAAAQNPLPVVQQPRGKQQSTFLDETGEVDLIQPGMSRRESAAQRRAREFAARNKKARQKLVAETLGQNIPEAPIAVQEPVTKGVDVRQPTENGENGKKAAKGTTQGDTPAAKGQAEGKVNVAATPVVEQGRQGASNNTPTGVGTGESAGAGIGRRVRGRAGAPAASDSTTVVVGDTASEPVASVAEEAPTKESPYAKKKERESELREYVAAYEALEKPADVPLSKFKKTRIAYLTSIAEVEANADTGTSKAAARKYLEGIPDKDEVAQARRAAATTVKNVSEVEAKLAARDAAIEKRTAAWEAELADTDGKGKKPSASDKKLARHLAEYAEDGKPFFSVGSAVKDGGMSAKAVRTRLQGLFNSPTRFDALINVVENETELPLKMLKALKTVENGAVGGFFNPESGKVWIIANNMANEREAQAVFLHEVGVHMGMRNLLGKQNYDKLIGQLDAWEKAGTGAEGKLAKKATQRAAQAEAAAKQTPNVERFNEERLAYFVEEAVLAGIDPTAIATQSKSLQAWFRRLWQSLQTAMRKLGIAPNRLQASDVVDLAYGSAYIALDSENIDVTATTLDQEAGIKYSISSPTTLKTLTDYKAATDAAKGLADKVSKTKLADMKLSTFKMMIPWLTKHHMISQFDKWMNGGLAMNGRADSIQETMTTRMNQLFNEPHQRFLAIERADKERAKKITELMQATEFQIDPRKSWDKHTHLHSLTGWQLQQAKDFVAQYGQIWGKMAKEDRQVYNDLAKMNQTMYTAELALGLYNMARANPSAKDLPAFQADPSEQFRGSTTTHGSIDAAQDYWRGVMEKYTAALDHHVEQQRGLLPQKAEADPDYQSMVKSVLRGIQSEKAKQLVRRALRTKEDKDLSDEQKKIARHLSPLEAQMRMVNETAATFEHAPYFHLGRFGDHFVSFRVRTGEDDLADPAAMAHVQAQLAKAFPKITIRSDATDPHVFARFESVGEQQEFEKAVREMQTQGWLMQPGVKDKNNQDLGDVVSGTRNAVISGYHTAGPNWLTRVVESIQAEDYDDATKEHMVAHVRSLYLDSLPDNAAIKVKQKREGRPGWDADMMRSYAHRMRIGSNRVGSLAAEPTRTQSFAVMKDAQAKAQIDPNLSAPRRGQIAAVVSEFERRNSDQMSVPNTPAIDKLRALNHAYFLGMSPSYVLIQMTQLGVLTWPELAKKSGFVKSAKAIAEVTPIALKVMSTVIKEGYKQRGVKGAADMVVTSEILEKAGVSEADADFIIKVMAAGKIDIGNAAREIGRVAEGETGSEALKIASSFGYASETVTRITTALASKRLYDAKPTNQKPASDVVKYAIEVIDESMLNYTSTNIGRMTGKQGVASTWTPVMFSFLQYQFQLLEKMYREFYNAYTSDPSLSKEEREAKQKEARRFLGSHMFSMLTLAGTLGLPFATAIAAAADKLCGMFSDDYCDSKTALRNMTTEMFGHDIEPLVSKGLLSRALGFDISERAGEGNLLPFSKFLADKRKMEDALKDLAWSSWGAPSSMIAGIYKGYKRMADGDMVGGMQEAVPLALKGPIKAFEMSEKGYTDKAGNVLPMTPGAYDIMLQVIGLNPGEKADYQQAKFAQSQRKGVLTREGTVIRQKLASAIERGDETAMRDWMAKAQDYDAKNPARGILPTMGATLQQRARAKAQAVGTGTPLGVSVRDYEAQQFTSFYRP